MANFTYEQIRAQFEAAKGAVEHAYNVYEATYCFGPRFDGDPLFKEDHEAEYIVEEAYLKVLIVVEMLGIQSIQDKLKDDWILQREREGGVAEVYLLEDIGEYRPVAIGILRRYLRHVNDIVMHKSPPDKKHIEQTQRQAEGEEKMTREELLDSILALNDGELDLVRAKLHVPANILPDTSLAQRAIALFDYCEVRHMHASLMEVVEKVKSLPATSRTESQTTINVQGDYIVGDQKKGNTYSGNFNSGGGPMSIGDGNTTTVENSNSTVTNSGQMAGVAIGHGATAKVKGSITQTTGAPPQSGDTIDAEQFKEDVTAILHAMLDHQETLEAKLGEDFYERQDNAFKKAKKLNVAENKIEEVYNMIEDIWINETSNDFKTTIQKLNGTDLLKTAMNSPVLKALIELAKAAP